MDPSANSVLGYRDLGWRAIFGEGQLEVSSINDILGRILIVHGQGTLSGYLVGLANTVCESTWICTPSLDPRMVSLCYMA